MATRMQQRRSPASDWATANPILAAGEIGYETDANKFKIGDGINHWADLTYFENADNIGGSLGEYVPLTQKGADNGVATLDSTGNVPFSQLGNIIDGAPGVLDTLNEIAAAIGDDASFITTITTSIGTKQDKVSGVSDTEIGYLDGVTSSIQTQLNSKLDSSNLTEAAQDAVNSALTAGTGITKTYDDAGNTITVAVDSTIATKTYVGTAVSTEATDRGNAVDGAVVYLEGYADTAKTEAISASETYTDTAISNLNLSTTYDVMGAADTAEANAKSYADTKISDLVDSAPSTLNTLNELAAALGDDANYASTITTALGLKAPLASPALTGTPTAPTATAGTNTTQLSTTAFVKTAIDAITTTGVAEGTNKYFTDQRAVDAIVYSINHGLDVTLDGGTP